MSQNSVLMWFKLNCFGFPVSDPDGFHFSVDPRLDYGVQRYEYFLTPRYIDHLPSRPFLYQDPEALRRILRYVAPVLIEKRDLRKYACQVMYSIRRDPFLVDNAEYFHFNTAFSATVGGRRLKLILMALDFVLQARIQNRPEPAQGLRLLFQALPDPQVTWHEIVGFLSSRVKFSPKESKRLYLKSVLDSCVACIPECLQAPKPRTLKHLARCEVRSCLGRARTRPNGVYSLQLPKTLEEFVLLETRKDEFRPAMGPLSDEAVFVLRPEPEIQSQEAS